MSDSGSAASDPLQDAILAWNAAVEAAMQDVYRIAQGGKPDPARTAELHAALEADRLRYEQLAAGLPPRSDVR